MQEWEFQWTHGPGGDLRHEIEYGNHSSAKKYEKEMKGEVIADVVRGRALVFPLEQAEVIRGLRISPVGVVEEKAMRRIVRDMTFGEHKRGRREGIGE